MNEYPDIRISGAGKLPGGRCGEVHISGAGKLLGAVECESFHISGAGKVEQGGLTVHGPLACSGSGQVEGPIRAQGLRTSGSVSAAGDIEIAEAASISGSLKTDGSLRAETLHVSGVCAAERGVRAGEIVVSGALKTPADVQAECFRSTGVLNIDGLLNAETVEIALHADNLIRSIGGGRVQVRRADSGSGFGILRRARLVCSQIEADEIDLEYTDAETVRGVNIHIGSECVIDRVEYSGSLRTEADCTVREKVKI